MSNNNNNNNNNYAREQYALLSRARESARALDQQTAARIAREDAAGKKRIAPSRVDPPAPPPAPPAGPDPFLRAVARRLPFGK